MINVTETTFGFDGNLKAKIRYKVKRHLGESKGTFPVGFGLQANPLRLIIFKDRQDNQIGECPPEMVKDWLGAAIADCGYYSELIYYTGVEELGHSGTYAMDVPIGAIQWLDISAVVEDFKKMLKYIEEHNP
ncbi:Uncharacterised protein [uncultured archaeon]|nr:Uncharacterised protein [uncultured archaeon]